MAGTEEQRNCSFPEDSESGFWATDVVGPETEITMGRGRVDSSTSTTAFFSHRKRTLSRPDVIELVEEPTPTRVLSPRDLAGTNAKEFVNHNGSSWDEKGKTGTEVDYSSWGRWHEHAVIQKANSWFKEYILHGVFRQRPLPHSKDGRHIELNVSRTTPLIDERRGHPYIDNHIRSSRYTIWSFFPAQLWFQFTKIANFYFLITGIIQLIPGLSTTGSFTTIVPLLVFLSFSIFREGWDDFRRYRLDRIENRRLARVLHGFRVGDGAKSGGQDSLRSIIERHWAKFNSANRGQGTGTAGVPAEPYGKEFSTTTTTVNSEDPEASHWTKVKWIDLRVGDIIETQRDEQVPADIVLLSAEGRDGLAYIETMALDGETNLKTRQPPSMLSKGCKTMIEISTCHAEFVLEDPNLDLYEFNGKVSLDGKTVPLTLANVVYRGSTLRNTTRMIGMVINTGEECKIRMNSNKNPQAKAPVIQSTTNHVVIYLSAFVILLSIGCSAGYLIWTKVYENKAWYLAHSHIRFADIFIAFAIMYNNLIPLALYVSLEIVKLCQFLLLQDIEMYDEVSNTPMVSNTQTIYENLGQISYIFSDKTGTLTENVMRFRKMSVAGTIWTHNSDDRADLHHMDSKTKEEKALFRVQQNAALGRSSVIPSLVDEDEILTSHQSRDHSSSLVMRNSMPDRSSNTEQPTSALQHHILTEPGPSSDAIKMFLLSVALCHTCFPELQEDGKITYQAASPDEYALVEAAHEMGYSLLSRDSHLITLEISSVETEGMSQETYEVLDVIEFSTHRKRMSIVVRFPDGRICLFCKGADSIMQPRFATQAPLESKELGQDEVHDKVASEVFDLCHQHINSFASEGLRTLVYGHRFIPESEYAEWSSIYQAATTSLTNRQAMIEAAGELIEKDLVLGGATAIEDKLQKGVPETIEKLRKANIKIWMLTGDKRETAINIAHSAHICRPDSKFIILDHHKPDPIDAQISSAASELTAATTSRSVIVIDGQTLVSIDQNKQLSTTFYTLLLTATSVIVCRASPSQKASMVRSIRHLQPTHLTLAIGDGGNDIAMITEAHVGIGISGKEGLQAARVADYSIAQFRFLQRLLLVHGHWNYIRTAKFILYTFWKEMLFYCVQLLYQRWNGYTGTSLFESDSLTVWNTLFSSLCVIIPGIFEKDLSAETLLEVPELYRVGQEGREFNMRSYGAWMGVAAVEAVVVYFLVYGLYGRVMMKGDEGLFAFGDLLFSVCVVFINAKLLFLVYHHLTWIPLASLLATITGWWAWNFFLSGIYARAPGPYYVRDAFTYHFGEDLLWWAVLLIVVMVVMVIEIIIEVVRKRWWPTEVDLWQEREAEKARTKTRTSDDHGN
ncbi:phospholipid-translocating P-type ATPase [Mollisia scopiformis]|uniref:Phospholipid-transporting ATPase n=1 Tax=Mollisia scopiformis TaxID=149040 RepID=A0A194WXC4_MOLSC|nr:phospholipid-translocating P-type ATPase [Mollisia scopiformis]KUJ12633.1 phospholipid-translocating P-type ATPase [Mollisia scopiformis]